jgi:predicted nucleic acid-binding protein
MPEAVLDTMVLQALGFGHPDGLAILLTALNAARVQIPAEIYSQDEDSLPIERADRGIGEFGRGLRFARRQARELTAAEAARYQRWLANAQQLALHIASGELMIAVLDPAETQRREALVTQYGIGRGEAACLVVAKRHDYPALFVSSDEVACRVAQAISVPYITLVDVLEQWIARSKPSRELFDELIDGMALARFRLSTTSLEELRRQLR